MWDCQECSCGRIAASLTTCPMCGRERDMPTCTTGGASNANAVEGETGYVPPEVPEADGNVPEVAKDEPAEPAADVEVAEVPEPAKAVSAPKAAPARALGGGGGGAGGPAGDLKVTVT